MRVSLISNSLQNQLDVLQFYSTLTLHARSFCRLRVQSHRLLSPHPHSGVTRSSDGLAINETSPWPPPPVWLVCYIQQLIELRKTVYYLPVYYRRIWQNIHMNILMEELHKARYVGRGTELPCSLQERHSPRIYTHSSTQKLSKLHTFRIFIRVH